MFSTFKDHKNSCGNNNKIKYMFAILNLGMSIYD